MRMIQCDRCGKIFDEPVKKTGAPRLFTIHERARVTSPDGSIDLCEDCYQSLLDWMHDAEVD